MNNKVHNINTKAVITNNKIKQINELEQLQK